MAQTVKNLPTVGVRVRSQSQEDPLENEMPTHCRILAQRIQWTIMSVFEFYKTNTIGNIKNRPERVREGAQTSGNRESVIFIYEELMGFSIGR